ncbi:MAG TPA: cytochrome c [Acidimicrobiales bacterium]|nr:cytochrome c [Acidimicrobiales bacterium]
MKPLVRVFEVLAVLGSAVFVIALFANEPADPASDPSGEIGPTTESADGQDLYGRRCAGCHGADGQGSVGPRLGGGAAIENFPDPADQATVIRNGRGGMPSFSSLSDEEIDALVVYTRDLPG